MIIIESSVPDMILESVKNVETANKITHQIWREDNTLLGYGIKDDVNKSIEVYPLRYIDVGQLYAEMDIQGLTDYSLRMNTSGDLDIIDSIKKAEDTLDLNGIKELKISRMKNRFESIKIRPRVQINLGTETEPNIFYVDGSKDDITNFQSYLDLLSATGQTSGYIKDADGNMQPVITDDLNTIIFKIKEYGLNLYQKKWAKEAELMSAATIDEVKAISIDII